jgi:glycosyltransferase involved in cell wall biosynthesis
MARVAVIQSDTAEPGGGQAVCAHVLDGLAPYHDVTLFSWAPPDVRAWDAWFGTRLHDHPFRHRAIADRYRRLPDVLRRQRLLRYALTLRHALARARDFDVLVSTGAEIAAPGAAVQYLHVPLFADGSELRLLEGRTVARSRQLLWRAYSGAARLLARGNAEAYRQPLTLTNSAWTAEHVREVLGVQPRVVWPPVPALPGPALPWAERENGFVCIGRIEPAKRVLEMIDCVEALRRAGHDVHLHVVGRGEGGYAERVRQRCRGSDAARYEGALDNAALGALLGRHRYGLHGFACEHFGIAVAQMVAAGCVVLAPDEGGQVELLGGEPALLYGDFAEAARKIARVAADPVLQQRLRTGLDATRARLADHDFGAAFRRFVEAALADGSTGAALSDPA